MGFWGVEFRGFRLRSPLEAGRPAEIFHGVCG